MVIRKQEQEQEQEQQQQQQPRNPFSFAGFPDNGPILTVLTAFTKPAWFTAGHTGAIVFVTLFQPAAMTFVTAVLPKPPWTVL